MLFCLQIIFNIDFLKIKSISDIKPFFLITDVKELDKFPNIMLSCLLDMPYCKNTKLIISNEDFEYYSKLFLYELENNMIYKNNILSSLLINFFNFNIYPNEKIYLNVSLNS